MLDMHAIGGFGEINLIMTLKHTLFKVWSLHYKSV